MALVVGDVVDEDVDAAAEGVSIRRDRRLQRGDVGDVGGLEVRSALPARARLASSTRSTKPTTAALPGERAHDVGADTSAPPVTITDLPRRPW